MKYVVGIDQSTQGTKAVLFDETGRLLCRTDKKHRQLVDERGWVSHDPEEIYQNTLTVFRELVIKSKIDKDDIVTVGISNQRETTAMWTRDGRPVTNAVVWQCSRAEQIVKRLYDSRDLVREKTGLPLSAYFPAAKMRWLLEHTAVSAAGGAADGSSCICRDDVSRGCICVGDVSRDGVCQSDCCLGTIDSWLIYRLTGGAYFATDVSNASRTQLFNIHTLSWDEELCRIFGIPLSMLPEIRDSNADFGSTDFDGYLVHKIPIHAVLGDSHAALFGQGCHAAGMVKATYGTGASIMMNTGDRCVKSETGLATSLAWGMDGRVSYVLEGNINYAGAVISWMQDDLKLISSPAEIASLLEWANKDDETVLIPAFTGLGAPYWRAEAQAMFYGMRRTTGKAELVKAAVESIAFQVRDVVKAMETDLGSLVAQLRADGGPTRNSYLMQFESDIAGTAILVSEQEKLSAIGAAYMAGIAAGIFKREVVFSNVHYREIQTEMDAESRKKVCDRWAQAVKKLL